MRFFIPNSGKPIEVILVTSNLTTGPTRYLVKAMQEKSLNMSEPHNKETNFIA